MSLTIQKIAEFQVQLEDVQEYIEKLKHRTDEINPKDMKLLLMSFDMTCSSFRFCLEDLAFYVKKKEGIK